MSKGQGGFRPGDPPRSRAMELARKSRTDLIAILRKMDAEDHFNVNSKYAGMSDDQLVGVILNREDDRRRNA